MKCHWSCDGCYEGDSSPQGCVKCAEGFKKLNGFCAEKCPDGMELNADGTECVCGSGCKECFGMDEGQFCYECLSQDDFLFEDMGRCFNECPKQFTTRLGEVLNVYAQVNQVGQNKCRFGCSDDQYTNEFWTDYANQCVNSCKDIANPPSFMVTD